MKKSIAVAAAAIILAGGAYYIVSSNSSMAQNGMMGGEMPPTPVKTLTIAQESIALYETLPGRTSAFKVAQIRPQVSGIVTERTFEEGSLVEEGQQLYQIDPAPYRAAHNRALADLQKARANAKAVEAKEKRYQELVKINAVSLQEYDDIKASLDQAKADIAVANAMVATAKINLDYTKVYAPIAGRTGKSSVTEGALVTAGQPEPLTTVTQLEPIYADMSQSTADMMRLRGKIDADRKNAVEIILNGTNELYEHTGTLQFSDVSVDETTSSVQLRAIVPNPDERLLPGLFVRARIHLGTQDAILVPQRATTRTPDGNLIVWTVAEDNTAQPRPIQIDREYNDQWIVSGGLQSGDVIIVEGYQKVGPGAPVAPEGEGQTPAGLIPAEQPPAAPEAMPAEDPVADTPQEQPAAIEDTQELFPETAPAQAMPAPMPQEEATPMDAPEASVEAPLSARDLLGMPTQESQPETPPAP